MDKRLYDALQFLEECKDEKAKHHMQQILNVCREYVKEINELDKRFKEQVQNNYCIFCGDNATEVRQSRYYCDDCCK